MANTSAGPDLTLELETPVDDDLELRNELGSWSRESDTGEEGGAWPPQEPPAEFVEIFVGGLPSDVTQEDVTDVFEKVGEVLSVELNRRKKTGECKGFGFVRYKDQLTAEVACRDIKEVNGKEVGVHISRPRETESDANILLAGLDSEGGINKLLKLIHAHPDRKAAVAAAIKAVMAQAPRRNGHRTASGDPSSSGDPLKSSEDLGDDPSLPDPSTFLHNFTRCRQLVERFRENPNTSNKTPLAILHEYATRLNLELQYVQNADSNLGPFTTGAKLMSPGGAVQYAAGEGRGRSKKEAKQVTAAAVLEDLLERVPMDNFLQTAKKAVVRGPTLSAGRGLTGLRGRGRGRTAGTYNRGSLDYLPGTFPNFSAGQGGSFNLPLNPSPTSLTQSAALLPQQADALRSLEGMQNAQRLRTYLASQTIDADMLARMRGHSLDSLTGNLHRQFVSAEAPLDMSAYGNSRSFDNSNFTAGVVGPDMQPQDVLFQRQRQAQYQPQFPAMPEATISNLASTNANLFSPQAFQTSGALPHLPFQQYH